MTTSPTPPILFARVLKDDGATVLVAGSASAAYDMLVRDGPDVLVSDIGMPAEDGYDFIRRVRSSSERPQARIPALAVTAYARLEDRARALTAGFDMYLSKPVVPVQLVAMVETLAKRSRESCAPAS